MMQAIMAILPASGAVEAPVATSTSSLQTHTNDREAAMRTRPRRLQASAQLLDGPDIPRSPLRQLRRL